VLGERESIKKKILDDWDNLNSLENLSRNRSGRASLKEGADVAVGD
jgi:hypothetical protein